MLLSDFLMECKISNSKGVATPIEVAYYDGFEKWIQNEAFEGKFFASLDDSYTGDYDFVDGELMDLEVTDLGLTVHVMVEQ